MPLRLYNTFEKREQEFVPQQQGKVTMYTCGPTVYGRPHIGNYSSFLMADLLRRWLEVGHGYTVTHVKNITDVGHLVADADEGEDKIEKQAMQEKQTPKGAAVPSRVVVSKADVLAIVEKYTEMYLEDEKALNMLEPEHRPRATEYVQQMIEITQTLIEKGNAYETDDGVYFAVETFAHYGKLSGNTLDKLDAGARIIIDEAKRHPADFALWKKCVGKNAHHVLRWPSPWGEGFPGWHIECSAMSSALLGQTIDIHTGGEDNIFPHHECEIAQSESCTGKQFVRLWLHKRRIDLAGTKMSKSLGNVLSIPDIIAKGFSPLDIRYYFLSVHYRTNLKFSFDGLESARKVRLKVVEWMETFSADAVHAVPHQESDTDPAIRSALTEFSDAMDADLNTSAALAAVFTLMHHYYAARMNKTPLYKEYALALEEFLMVVRKTFGCFEPEQAHELPPAVQVFVDQRSAARAAKNFAESDRLRDEIQKLGYEVRDAEGKQIVKKL